MKVLCLAEAINRASNAFKRSGGNLTVPEKIQIIPYATESRARSIGWHSSSVNGDDVAVGKAKRVFIAF